MATAIGSIERLPFEVDDPVTLYACAHLSSRVYVDGPSLQLPDGSQWHSLMRSEPNSNGYFGEAFQWHRNGSKGPVVIAHRGTVPTVRSALNDWDLFLAEETRDFSKCEPVAIKCAVRFSSQVRQKLPNESPRFVEIGHSIGGGYAGFCGALFNGQVISFDSPGIKHPVENGPYMDSLRRSIKNIVVVSGPCRPSLSILSAPNFVNTMGAHNHTVYRLFTAHVPVPTAEPGVWSRAVSAVWALASYAGVVATVDAIVERELRSHRIATMCEGLVPEGPILCRRMISWPTERKYKELNESAYAARWPGALPPEQANLLFEQLLRSNLRTYHPGPFAVPQGNSLDIANRVTALFKLFYVEVDLLPELLSWLGVPLDTGSVIV